MHRNAWWTLIVLVWSVGGELRSIVFNRGLGYRGGRKLPLFAALSRAGVTQLSPKRLPGRHALSVILQDGSHYCQQTRDGRVIPKPYRGTTKRNIRCGPPGTAPQPPLSISTSRYWYFRCALALVLGALTSIASAQAPGDSGRRSDRTRSQTHHEGQPWENPPHGEAHPTKPNSQRQPEPTPRPAPRGKYPKNDPMGATVRYFIDGLGTNHVVARSESNGTKTDLSADMQTRSNGVVNGVFQPREMEFDQTTGLQWNWVGSNRSGGPRTPIWPGGIGDVNVGTVNDFDRAAKKHDIQSWLEANFVAGADVSLTINGAWTPYPVKSFVALNKEVMDEFTQATEDTLNRALRRAQEAGSQRDVNTITQLQNNFHSLLNLNPLARADVIRTVLHDPMFRPVLEPAAPGRRSP